LDEDFASELSLPVHNGILIWRVYRGSSADKAGIQGANQIAVLYNRRWGIGGDILTEVAGKPVGSIEELQLALEAKRAGETVQVTIYRGRSKMQKSVVLMEAPRQSNTLF
jgi:S1-C subfamily serine protease